MSALSLPPLPSWEGLHPLVVHFPVALLLVSPLFVLLGLLPKIGRGFSHAALALLLLGTIAAYVAVETGEASAGLITRTEQVSKVLEQHQELAETARNLFTVMTVLYAALIFAPPIYERATRKRIKPVIPLVATVVFVILLGLCVIVLANAAHLGGRMVHELGVQAWSAGT